MAQTYSHTVLSISEDRYHPHGKQGDKIYQNYKCTYYFDLALPHLGINLLNLLAQMHTD